MFRSCLSCRSLLTLEVTVPLPHVSRDAMRIAKRATLTLKVLRAPLLSIEYNTTCGYTTVLENLVVLHFVRQHVTCRPIRCC
jgi:hypothetical protein